MGCSASAAEPVYPTSWRSWPIGLADADSPVVAVDLPSGVESDTGAVPAASIGATRTVTFGVFKACHLLEPARSRSGLVELVDIGLPLDDATPALAAWEEADVVAGWPVPGATADKYARGVVGIDTGSDHYPGAAILSTFGAVFGGAGHGPLPRPCRRRSRCCSTSCRTSSTPRGGCSPGCSVRGGATAPAGPDGWRTRSPPGCPSCSTRTHCGTCRTASPNRCS